MKPIKRLFIIIVFIILLGLVPFEVIYYTVRWIWNGASFPDVPLCVKVGINLIDPD